MTEPHDWPMDKPPTGHDRRPWIFSAKGYLLALIKDREEARRAQRGLQERGVPAEDIRLYAPTRNDANRLLRLLVDYDVSYVRHDSDEGVRDLTLDTG